jgi:hypothetical protein
MKSIHSLRDSLHWFFSIALLLSSFVSQAQVEPQFKFYLAFEDATNQRDTVWIVIDTNATEEFLDSTLGETNEILDSTKFQTWVLTNMNDSVLKTLCFPLRVINSYSIYIKSRNGELPITMRWDTNLLNNHNLPFEFKSVWVENNYFNVFVAETLNIKEVDSVFLDPFFEGGGPGEHFPLQATFSDKISYLNVSEIGDDNKGIKIFPNPKADLLTIEISSKISETDAYLRTLSGELIERFQLADGINYLNTQSMNSGVYILSIIGAQYTVHEPIVISR